MDPRNVDENFCQLKFTKIHQLKIQQHSISGYGQESSKMVRYCYSVVKNTGFSNGKAWV